MDKKQILISLTQELSLKRSNAQTKAFNNRKKALVDQDFAKLDKREKELTLEIGKLKAFDLDTSKQAKELEKIHKEMNKKLILIGLTKDDLIPEYECKTAKIQAILMVKCAPV